MCVRAHVYRSVTLWWQFASAKIGKIQQGTLMSVARGEAVVEHGKYLSFITKIHTSVT